MSSYSQLWELDIPRVSPVVKLFLVFPLTIACVFSIALHSPSLPSWISSRSNYNTEIKKYEWIPVLFVHFQELLVGVCFFSDQPGHLASIIPDCTRAVPHINSRHIHIKAAVNFDKFCSVSHSSCNEFPPTGSAQNGQHTPVQVGSQSWKMKIWGGFLHSD